MTKAKPRLAGIDLVRVIAMIAVIAGHMWASRPGMEHLRAAIYMWNVPVFFFLTGYFWRPGRTLGSEVRTRGRTLLLPLLCWAVIVGVPTVTILIMNGAQAGPTLESLVFLGSYVSGGALAPFWFLPVLFFAAVLARALEPHPVAAWAIAILGVAAATLLPALVAAVPWDLLVALPCLLFVLVGQAFRRFRHRVPMPWLVGGVSVLAPISIAVVGLIAPLDLRAADLGTPALSILGSLIVCAGLTLLGAGIPVRSVSRFGRALTEMATVAVPVLLTHVALFYVVGLLVRNLSVRFVIATAAAYGIATVLHRTPLSPWLVGVPQLPRPAVRVRVRQAEPL